MDWYLYIVKCADESLYTGITKDLERRIKEHNNNNLLGSKYTKYRRPVKLIYSETFGNRSEASKRESEIKSWAREEKLKLISGVKNAINGKLNA